MMKKLISILIFLAWFTVYSQVDTVPDFAPSRHYYGEYFSKGLKMGKTGTIDPLSPAWNTNDLFGTIKIADNLTALQSINAVFLDEGTLGYVKDTDQTYQYNGSSWDLWSAGGGVSINDVQSEISDSLNKLREDAIDIATENISTEGNWTNSGTWNYSDTVKGVRFYDNRWVDYYPISTDAAMLSQALSSSDHVIIDGELVINGDISPGANKIIEFLPGAKIISSSGTFTGDTTTLIMPYGQYCLDSRMNYSGTFIIDKVQLEYLGAAGDGTTDDSQAFSKAVSLAKLTTGKTIEGIGGKTYKVSTAVDPEDLSFRNITLHNYKNASIFFQSYLSEPWLTADSTDFTNQVFEGETVIMVDDVSDLSAGDYVGLRCDDLTTLETDGGESNLYGEIGQIYRVGADYIVLHLPVNHNFYMSSNPRVVKLNMYENVHWENVTIGMYTSEGSGLNLNGYANSTFKNITTYCAVNDVSMDRGITVNIAYNCKFSDMTSFGFRSNSGVGYAFSSNGSTNCVIENSILLNSKHCASFGGLYDFLPVNNTVIGSILSPMNRDEELANLMAITTHSSGYSLHVKNCIFIGGINDYYAGLIEQWSADSTYAKNEVVQRFKNLYVANNFATPNTNKDPLAQNSATYWQTLFGNQYGIALQGGKMWVNNCDFYNFNVGIYQSSDSLAQTWLYAKDNNFYNCVRGIFVSGDDLIQVLDISGVNLTNNEPTQNQNGNNAAVYINTDIGDYVKIKDIESYNNAAITMGSDFSDTTLIIHDISSSVDTTIDKLTIHNYGIINLSDHLKRLVLFDVSCENIPLFKDAGSVDDFIISIYGFNVTNSMDGVIYTNDSDCSIELSNGEITGWADYSYTNRLVDQSGTGSVNYIRLSNVKATNISQVASFNYTTLYLLNSDIGDITGTGGTPTNLVVDQWREFNVMADADSVWLANASFSWVSSLQGGGGGAGSWVGTATSNLTLGSYYISGDGDNEGIQVGSTGVVGLGVTSNYACIGGTNISSYPYLRKATNDFFIANPISNQDMIFTINDGGVAKNVMLLNGINAGVLIKSGLSATDAPTSTLTVEGTANVTDAFFVRQVTYSTSMNADVAGDEGEMVYCTTDKKSYVCTTTGAAGAAVWAALN